ncbi:hypothetical protein C8F04DRAFT_1273616 [Mycena alexandri]|uniref:Uncharacterized protein n=1 Tax=Mycena alexandri TaxID=1745969 RepID=A0AAD6S6U7_9AGAR|nr:hypothetical protein C8F04DRAFT_1273616 [Mycena alexandri]
MPRGRKTKFGPDRVEWLLDQFPDFENAQRNSRLPAFWSKMERGFFKKWSEETALGLEQPAPDDGSAEAAPPMPEEDVVLLGKATTKRKKQLKSWFNNNGQKLKRSGDTISIGKQGSLAVRLFKSLVKKRRRLQEVEIYQKRNRDKIRKAVEYAKSKVGMSSSDSSSSESDSSESGSESDSDGSGSESDSSESGSESDSDGSGSESDSASSNSDDGDAPGGSSSNAAGGRFKKKMSASKRVKLDRRGRAQAMSLRRRVAQALFEKESEEEKAIVRKLYLEQKGHGEDDHELNKSAEERTPEQIQAAIDELEGIVAEFHAAIFKMTGWVGVSVLGGPTPEEKGSITQKTFASGESPAGLTLPASLPHWDHVLQGTGQWLKRLDYRAVRKAHALTAKPDAPEFSSATDPPPPVTQQAVPQSNNTTTKKAKAPAKPKKLGKKAAAAAAATASADWVDVYGPAIPFPGSPNDAVNPAQEPASANTDPAQDITEKPADGGSGTGAGAPPSWVDEDFQNDGFQDELIDPALRGEDETPVSSTAATTDTNPSNAGSTPDLGLDPNGMQSSYLSPIVKEFGALDNAAAAVDPATYQSLNAAMSSFRYDATIPRTPLGDQDVYSSGGSPASTGKASLEGAQFSSPTSATAPRPPPRPAWGSASTPTPLLHGPSPLRGSITSATAASSSPGPTTPPRHRRVDRASSGSPTSGGTPVASTGTPVAEDDVLTPEHFPDSRPSCNPPLAVRIDTSHEGGAPRGGRGQGCGARGGGASRGPRGRGRGASANRGGGGGHLVGKTAADLGYSFMQTYDGDGNIVPLPLDTVVQAAPTADSRRIKAMEKAAGRKGKGAPPCKNHQKLC